ncbi:RusA family crossover junction endodeoxyribonuclease [Rhodovarius crocodyli]|uniref:RusA family crossover junction endodeoxyribonuclease n=1 Tax=Rhodovarius crocodyli TaxID=1979269 RepID=UPI0013E37A01|nr:RusA family crossover junction endodeoxyribonuclease [Rhodovarius crocodyli]
MSLHETRLVLPLPPSANRLWRVFKGQVRKSTDYRKWADDASDAVSHQLGGQARLTWFTASITLPVTRRDPDNAIKPIMDALQAGGAIQDDSMLRGLTLDVDDDCPAEWVSIGLFEAPAPRAVREVQEAQRRAWEAAHVLLTEHTAKLTPAPYGRCVRVRDLGPDNIPAPMAANMLALAERIMGRRA